MLEPLISKGVPSCQKPVQQNVKGIEFMKNKIAGLCRNSVQLSASAILFSWPEE